RTLAHRDFKSTALAYEPRRRDVRRGSPASRALGASGQRSRERAKDACRLANRINLCLTWEAHHAILSPADTPCRVLRAQCVASGVSRVDGKEREYAVGDTRRLAVEVSGSIGSTRRVRDPSVANVSQGRATASNTVKRQQEMT